MAVGLASCALITVKQIGSCLTWWCGSTGIVVRLLSWWYVQDWVLSCLWAMAMVAMPTMLTIYLAYTWDRSACVHGG